MKGQVMQPGSFEAGTQTDRSVRDRRDRRAPMGRATCDVSARVLASCGQAGPVAPQFTEAARGVRSGGVLAALPALLKEGLLAASDVLPLLPKGYYGLPTILLFLVFMTLARVRNPEGLRYQPRVGRHSGARPLPRGQDAAAQDRSDRQRRSQRSGLAARPRQALAGRGAGALGDAGRRRAHQGLHRPQGAPAQALRLAREVVPAGERQLLDQCPGRQAAALCAQDAGPEDGRRHRSRCDAGAARAWDRRCSGPDRSGTRSARAHPGLRP